MSDIVFKIDEQGRFVFIDESVRDMGYEPEELLGHHFSEILDPGDVHRVSLVHVLSESPSRVEETLKVFNERRTGNRRTTGLKVRIKTNHASGRQGKAGDHERATVLVEVNSAGLYEAKGASGIRLFVGTIGVIRL